MENMRIPPHHIEAEQSILGSMIMDIDAVVIASELLKADDFYRQSHKEIFNALIELYSNNIEIDIITLQDKLAEKGQLEQSGGLSYLGKIAIETPTSVHVKQYIKIVADKSKLRKLIKASSNISTKSYEAAENVSDIMAFAEKEISNILQCKA
ncbi:hypothetical protein AN641_01750 [Candidatus Epulonipiscioides gigas]|nr:hypothetical protein AN641_01750 [Epulopiscium sp. SCG-C07WGA-EpuloA2]